MAKEFSLTTSDPAFDPHAAVTINGFLFVPANYDMAGRVPKPGPRRKTVVEMKRRRLVESVR